LDIIYFKSAAEFRKWLEKNHSSETELFIGFYKKNSGIKGISYQEAVDEALCFGWIDGIKKRVDEVSYMHRFSPRKRFSIWSAVNIKRAEELINLGQMHPVGLKAFENRDPEKQKQYSYARSLTELDESYQTIFTKNIKAWDFFQLQPPSYRKVAVLWVTSAKKEETRLKRLNILIKDSANHKRLQAVTLKKE
jgi:uncharacterized protein YdeI (YjbR/CyaY-like superfamily)